MKMYGRIFAIIFLLSGTLVPYGMAQNTTNDFCQRHANMWDSDGRITLEGHKMLYLQQPEWWFDSKVKEWKEWPSQKTQWSIEDHKNLNTDGSEWWFNSQKKEWEESPQAKRETLDCHKKIYLSGPQWWFDSKNNEWKPWPK